jgi:hypothetical protein
MKRRKKSPRGEPKRQEKERVEKTREEKWAVRGGVGAGVYVRVDVEGIRLCVFIQALVCG